MLLTVELSPSPKTLLAIVKTVYPFPFIFTFDVPVTPICEVVVAFAPPYIFPAIFMSNSLLLSIPPMLTLVSPYITESYPPPYIFPLIVPLVICTLLVALFSVVPTFELVPLPPPYIEFEIVPPCIIIFVLCVTSPEL